MFDLGSSAGESRRTRRRRRTSREPLMAQIHRQMADRSDGARPWLALGWATVWSAQNVGSIHNADTRKARL